MTSKEKELRKDLENLIAMFIGSVTWFFAMFLAIVYEIVKPKRGK